MMQRTISLRTTTSTPTAPTNGWRQMGIRYQEKGDEYNEKECEEDLGFHNR